MADVNVDSLEKHRQRLEESLEKLRKALRHWQVYSAEYEGLREELLALPEDADRQTMLEIAKDFGGSVVTEKEITTFLGDKEGIKRTPKQVADIVKHRIDYVQKNAETVQRQLDQGENRLSTLKIVSQPDQVTNEEGLPIMNIKEELDEDGNVISSSATEEKPEAVPMDLKDIKGFEKYAKDDTQKITELDDDSEDEEEVDPKRAQRELDESIEKLNYLAKEVRASGQDPKTFLKNNMDMSMSSQPPKKEEAEAKAKSAPIEKPENKAAPPTKKVERKPDHERTNKEVSVDEVPQPATIKVIDDLPNDFSNAPEVEESEEDARLRQEMIRYNLGEVGAIVAELELEEDNDDDDWEDDFEEDYEDDEDEDEEQEDEYGRSTRQFITDDLRAEMEALQRKLLGDGAAKRQEAIKIANEKEAEERRQTEEKAKTEAKEKKPKKGVRFAETLDISQAAEIPPETGESPPTPSILDMVFGPGTKDADAKLYNPTAEAPKPRGPSLFKQSRQAATENSLTADDVVVEASRNQNQPLPKANRPPIGDIAERPSSNVPKGKAPSRDLSKDVFEKDNNDAASAPQPLLSNTIMERPPKPTSAKKPVAPSLETDELDPELHMQEVTMAHFQMRNKLIQRQGGFIERDEEKAIIPIDENGEPVKISRFKAARVRNEL